MQSKLSGRQAEFRPCFGATYSPLEKREIAWARALMELCWGKVINIAERPGTSHLTREKIHNYLENCELVKPGKELSLGVLFHDRQPQQ